MVTMSNLARLEHWDPLELRGRSVKWLTRDHEDRPLAIVDGATVCRRDASGTWSSVVEVEAPLACCVMSGPAHYPGSNRNRAGH
jgi:hypothetical protein